MNEKKAKKLRAIAKMIIAKKQNETSANLSETAYTENRNNRKMYHRYKVDQKGQIVFGEDQMPIIEQSIPIAAGTITVADECLRGVYKNLKRSAK